jgi:hypothetical protein
MGAAKAKADSPAAAKKEVEKRMAQRNDSEQKRVKSDNCSTKQENGGGKHRI